MRWHYPNHSHAHPPWHPFNASFTGWVMHHVDVITQKERVIDMLAKVYNEALDAAGQLDEGERMYRRFMKDSRLLDHLIHRLEVLP